MNMIDKINNYGSVSAINRIAGVNKTKNSNSFYNQYNSLELAKKATQPDQFDLFDKEKEQTIGGMNINDILLTYNRFDSNKVNKHIEQEWKNHKSEYSYLADGGEIAYNGVAFQYDEESDSISLGDMSNKDNILTINLSGGTVLHVNRNDIDSLVKAIGMFKPEDVKKIMDAIAIDAKSRNKPIEVEKEQTDTFNEMMDKIEGKEDEKQLV